jgi:hypothetical protein
MTDEFNKVLERLAKEKREKLGQRMAERIASLPMPKKCPSCGYAPCQCLCDPDCPNCGGSGYMKQSSPDAQVTDKKFGTLKTCPKMKANNLKKSIAAGETRGGLSAYEIQTLDWSLVRPGISDGMKGLAFVRPAVQRGYGMGIMLGKVGQAKTLLMKISVATYIRAGKKAHYIKLTNLLDDIRRVYDLKEDKMVSLVRKIKEWESYDLLAIDEMDKSSETDWATDRLFGLCDERWVKAVRKEALTLFASNYASKKEIPEYLLSRIEDARFNITDDKGRPASFVVYLAGVDGRKSMPKDWTH